jgi:hypothetical protein
MSGRLRPYSYSYGASGAPGTCRWCGRTMRLRSYYAAWSMSEPEPTLPEGARVRKRREPKGSTEGCLEYVVAGQPAGDYRDGHFCGLRCGYAFGVRLADLGNRLVPSSETTLSAGRRA